MHLARKKQRPIVIAIGGSDPLGAAGLAADIKALTTLGVHTCPIVTAITFQNNGTYFGERSISAVDIKRQIEAISSSSAISAVKIGMLFEPDAVQAIGEFLKLWQAPVIWDPVMAATAGQNLWRPETLSAFREYILPNLSLITPNKPELDWLIRTLGLEGSTDPGLALKKILQTSILIKGGHEERSEARDRLLHQCEDFTLAMQRREASIRGSGCTLASLIAGYLAWGQSLEDAVILAKASLTKAIDLGYRVASKRMLRPQSWQDEDPLPTIQNSFAPLKKPRPFAPITGGPLGVYPIISRCAQLSPLIKHGITTAQVRIKDLRGAALEKELSATIQLSKQHGIRLFVNDFWQLAISNAAYGVHLGQEDLLTADLDAISAAGLRLGISTHSYKEAIIAAQLSPSYIALGPIFETTCKSMAFGPQGVERVGHWVKTFDPIRVVAIGGLKPEHIRPLRYQGADGVAVISDILLDADPGRRCGHWLTEWSTAAEKTAGSNCQGSRHP